MPLDPQIKALIDQIASLNAPLLWEMTPGEARNSFRTMALMAGKGEDVASVEDRTIEVPSGPLPVRIYKPTEETPLPVLVFFHGGGFVIGDLDTHDRTCRELANRAGCMVIAVDYRLAPEHRFPDGVVDACTSLEWVARHAAELGGDPQRLAVGGDSAGGNLAAVTTLWAREVGIPLRFQLLFYPAVDMESDEYPSREENSQGYMLDKEAQEWFVGHYFGENPPDLTNWRLAPIRAASHADLPPALIITAEFDPLRDEGAAYARTLEAAGVPATVTCYEGMIHGFVGLSPFVASAHKAVDEAGAALRQALAE
jgi:acetyl esterase